MEQIKDVVLTGSLIFLAVLAFACLLRAILGPRFTDRILAVNVIGTISVIMICVLSVLTGKSYLIDVALIYSLVGFLSVVVLCKVYLTHYSDKHEGYHTGNGGTDA